MEKKNRTQKRNERPNVEEEDRADKGGLKTDLRDQGLKSDESKLPEAEPEGAMEEDVDTIDDEDSQ